MTTKEVAKAKGLENSLQALRTQYECGNEIAKVSLGGLVLTMPNQELR